MITSLDEEKNFTTVKKSPFRAYHCIPCNWTGLRKDVWKMGGVFKHPACGGEVKDVTKEYSQDLINIGI